MNRLRRLVIHALSATAVGLLLGSPVEAQVQDLPPERYEEWVRESVHSWQIREVEMVLGQEWRDASAGRDLLEALRQTDLPLQRWEPHPRFTGRICPRTRATAQCATVSFMTHGPRRDLRDIPPSEIEAVIWVGPTGPVGRMAWDAQSEVERVILFERGYLSEER